MADDQAQAPARAPPTFSQTLLNLRRGRVQRELTELLQEATLAVQDRGGKATIQLAITLKKNKGGVIEVTDDVKARLPQLDRGVSIFWPDEQGGLHRSDPNQDELPFRGVTPMRADAGGSVTS